MEVRKKYYNEALPQTSLREKKKVKIKSAKRIAVAEKRTSSVSLYKAASVFVFIFFISMALLATYGSTLVNMQNKELKKVEISRTELEGHRDYLIMNLEPYKDANRIEEIARSSLGMDYPRKDQYIPMNLEGRTKNLFTNKGKTSDIGKNE